MFNISDLKGPLSGFSLNDSQVVAPEDAKTSGTWSRSRWCQCDTRGWMCSCLSCLPAAGDEFASGLGELSGRTSVSYHHCLRSFASKPDLHVWCRWLFAERRGADTNFRMVRKKVSSEAADPTLSHGFSFFVDVKKYYNHLAKYGVQVEEVRKIFNTRVRHYISTSLHAT